MSWVIRAVFERVNVISTTTRQHTTTHDNTRQHTTTHDNTQEHTRTHKNTQQHTRTHNNTQEHNTTPHTPPRSSPPFPPSFSSPTPPPTTTHTAVTIKKARFTSPSQPRCFHVGNDPRWIGDSSGCVLLLFMLDGS